jgi:hypothetical protein
MKGMVCSYSHEEGYIITNIITNMIMHSHPKKNALTIKTKA